MEDNCSSILRPICVVYQNWSISISFTKLPKTFFFCNNHNSEFEF